MPAQVADIRRALREATVVEVSGTTGDTIKARFPFARDMRAEPAEGFFDAAADCTAALTARQALIGGEIRRFSVQIGEIVWPGSDYVADCWRLVDAEQDVDGKMLVAREEIDTEEEVTRMELVG